jgi:hypothetical protein
MKQIFASLLFLLLITAGCRNDVVPANYGMRITGTYNCTCHNVTHFTSSIGDVDTTFTCQITVIQVPDKVNCVYINNTSPSSSTIYYTVNRDYTLKDYSGLSFNPDVDSVYYHYHNQGMGQSYSQDVIGKK